MEKDFISKLVAVFALIIAVLILIMGIFFLGRSTGILKEVGDNCREVEVVEAEVEDYGYKETSDPTYRTPHPNFNFPTPSYDTPQLKVATDWRGKSIRCYDVTGKWIPY